MVNLYIFELFNIHNFVFTCFLHSFIFYFLANTYLLTYNIFLNPGDIPVILNLCY